MMKIGGDERPVTLTTDHASSSYGRPVVVDADGNAHGPSDESMIYCDDEEESLALEAAGYFVQGCKPGTL